MAATVVGRERRRRVNFRHEGGLVATEASRIGHDGVVTAQRLLEVIALSADDAIAAQAGGADRVELVAEMAADGLSPTPRTVADVIGAVDIPVRMMLRGHAGFTAEGMDALRGATAALRAAGAQEFVLGFLDGTSAIDLAATDALVRELDGAAWTFHRAIDHCVDRQMLWRNAYRWTGLDTVLTAGASDGVDAGIETLVDEARGAHAASDHPVRILVGGGLQLDHLPRLKTEGVNAFHIGGAARPHGWGAPVDRDAVRRWRTAIDA